MIGGNWEFINLVHIYLATTNVSTAMKINIMLKIPPRNLFLAQVTIIKITNIVTYGKFHYGNHDVERIFKFDQQYFFL